MSKARLTKRERALGRLERWLKKFKNKDRGFVQDLLWKFRVHGYLTEKQWYWVMKLAEENPKPKPKSKETHYLYAIVADHKVKLGYSKKPKGRLKSIQIGNPHKANLAWVLAAGDETEAKRLEKKLHRFCKEFHLRGEWFNTGCMTYVKRFKIKDAERRELEHSELEIMNEAVSRI